MCDCSLPVVGPEAFPDDKPNREMSVWGVLLAAGTSSRYGASNKLLQPFDGESIVRHAAVSLAGAPLDGVVAVVGHQSSAVWGAVDDIVTAVRVNDDFEDGQSASVKAGIEAVREHDADAAVIALGDMPTVQTGTVQQLIDGYERGVGTALAAAYECQRGNPVLFDSQYFDTLSDIDGDVGGREILLSTNDAALIATGDPGVLCDVDRPSDLDELVSSAVSDGSNLS